MRTYKEFLSEINTLEKQLPMAWTRERKRAIFQIKRLMKEFNISIVDLNNAFAKADLEAYISNGVAKNASMKFIDLFAGCGGLSLGLISAGCTGVFAVEKSPLAFSTLKHNLINSKRRGFEWPEWLPVEPMTCEDLLSSYSNRLGQLAGEIDLIVGGPPCQGFSTAGKRDPADPRNKMTEQYLSLVGLIKPRFIVIENVAGYNIKFKEKDGATGWQVGKGKKESYADHIAGRLEGLGYKVWSNLINCAEFGVPQMRQRFIIICEYTRDLDGRKSSSDLIEELRSSATSFREKRGLIGNNYVGVEQAISDLETTGRRIVQCTDSLASGFTEAEYVVPAKLTPYQSLMRKGAPLELIPNSRRLANHKPSTKKYFELVRSVCRPGISLSDEERREVGTQKQSTTVLSRIKPAPTVTTLPDDFLHYSEDRILTVREMARLQSFPDWFAFQGKYTTGGSKRKLECPRYTQVGNAVPPLLSQAIGEVLMMRFKMLKIELEHNKEATKDTVVQSRIALA